MEKIVPIYSGKREDFHWVGFGSGSGTNLRECAKVIMPSLIVSDRPNAALLELPELKEVPKIVRNGYEYCGSWKKAKGNPELEAEYTRKSADFHASILESITEISEKMDLTIDLIVLGGYMRLIKGPLLDAFSDRIINVHPGDLSLGFGGNRFYTGLDAVRLALESKEKYIRSSVIIADGGEDSGEILTQGPIVGTPDRFLEGDEDERLALIEKSIDSYQGLIKEKSDWPALTRALTLIADGRLAIGQNRIDVGTRRTIYLDGKIHFPSLHLVT